MDLSTKGSGQVTVRDQAMEYRSGKMALSMLVSGSMIRQMVMASYFMQMVIYMKVTGLMIWLMAEGSTLTQMEQYMMESGVKMHRKDLEWSAGQMVLGMKESM
jgi:hypothetical protein